ncbi:hypothetical protein BP6252_12652 [Coleophoma cylindrospora]|uniref:DUF1941-domain-containing protein n=1 Tax=Coleophoma cylindrospora TaxID=1849047 RepID=A0A3D8QCI3_9HELO|nr:hypothetical protein BP6252_12652 [Coleophoma cylindrospora]
MAEPSASAVINEAAASPLTSEDATFEKLQSLLRAKDDTSRFVGLALLKSVLDNGAISQDAAKIQVIWESLSPKFLDRLLKAGQSQKINKAEARDMVDLAVAVLHTFTILLPESSQNVSRLLGRSGPLVNALVQSSPETTTLILQTLLTFVSHVEGALELLKVEDITPLTELADQYPLVLDILEFMWTNASAVPSEAMAVSSSIDKVMPTLIILFQDTDAVTFLRFVGSFMSKLMPEALPMNPKWLKQLVGMLRGLVQKRPTSVGRAAYTKLGAALLQAYPGVCSKMLFEDNGISNIDSKPFAYLFVNLILIDIRSSFPSLLAQLNSAEYPATAERLSAAFDVLSGFIGFLVKSLDDESSSFSMPPDLLLKLRKDIAETMSLAIEYFRDRWDSAIAGASGLHPSARSGTSATSEGTRLTLTWDSMKDKPNADPLILAGIRALAIWIREDENENLRNESAGLMDMFMELYKQSAKDGLDFRYPILTALEAVMETEEDGVLRFLEQDGWETLLQDLRLILASINGQDIYNDTPTLARGIEIIRILLTVVDHSSTAYPREDWMAIVTLTASLKAPPLSPKPHPLLVEFDIAMLQLATALLGKAPGGMRKRYLPSATASRGLEAQLELIVKGMEDVQLSQDFMTELEDVRNLGFSSLP